MLLSVGQNDCLRPNSRDPIQLCNVTLQRITGRVIDFLASVVDPPLAVHTELVAFEGQD